MAKVRDIKAGDLIRAEWLGHGWYKVLDVGTDWSGSGKIYLAIEGYGSLVISADEDVERK